MEKTKIEVREALANDFNTPKALNSIIDLITFTTKMLHSSTKDFKIAKSVSFSTASFFLFLH